MPSPLFVLVCAIVAAACVVAAIQFTIHCVHWMRIAAEVARDLAGKAYAHRRTAW